ncbi:MAG: DUF551 domain-containing protein [Oscillospiraceae bacterium]|nr:DUF551 domain-containing protein [Oscillospiraceae bacterium]
MKIDELIRDLKHTVLHLPWSEIRKDVDEVVGRAVATLEAQQGRIAELEAELKEERYRHDRLQDFEVAEAQVLAKLREERRWIPVGERLPEDNGRYLCNVKSFAFPGCFYQAILQCDKHGFREGNIYTDDVTNWMPLPVPPEVDD